MLNLSTDSDMWLVSVGNVKFTYRFRSVGNICR